MNKKPRCDSVLKNLPPERQREVIDLLNEKGLKQTKQHLAQDGIKTSVGALSEFFSWWSLRQQFQLLEQDTVTMMELLRKQAPELSEEKVETYGNAFFQLEAIKQSDPKTFLNYRTARHKAKMDRLKFDQREKQIAQKDQQLALDEKKFQRDTCELFVTWAQDQRARQIVEGPESNDAKTEQLGQLIFGEKWK